MTFTSYQPVCGPYPDGEMNMSLSKSISIYLFSLALLVAWTAPALAVKSKQVTSKLEDTWEQCTIERQSCGMKCGDQFNAKAEKGGATQKDMKRAAKCVNTCDKAYDKCQTATGVIANAMKKSKDRNKKKALKKIALSWEKADDKCRDKYAKARADEVFAATRGPYKHQADSKLFKCQKRAKTKHLAKMEEVLKLEKLPE
jgi:hypothetical protein